jgi:hypothetical protein
MPGSNIAYPSQLGKSSGSSNDKKLTIIVGVIIILVVGSISYFLLKKPKKTESPKTINQVENEIKPTPTEKPKIDKKTLKIQVLNGTGTPGQAGKVVAALKEAEFHRKILKPPMPHLMTLPKHPSPPKKNTNKLPTR